MEEHGVRSILPAPSPVVEEMTEIYVSTDVETDGPIPGQNSLLSLGSAAFLANKTLVGTFSVNLEALPGASPHPRTMEWWKGHEEAWANCRTDLQPPEVAMPRYARWLRRLPGTPVFVAYPASFDFMFVYWYLMRFVGQSPFRHSALDIRTYAMAVLRSEWRCSSKAHMPSRWFDDFEHTHRAVDDAIEQGTLFCNILIEHLGGAQAVERISGLHSVEDEYERLIHDVSGSDDEDTDVTPLRR